MQRFWVCLFLILASSLPASEDKILPYLTSECDALSIIDGVVNAYNGKLIQVDRDIEILGPDPLDMTRYYDGGHHFDESEFGYGIGCSHPALVRHFMYNGKHFAAVEVRQGLEVLCELKKEKVEGKSAWVGRIAKEYYKTGYTNCCEALLKGEPSIYAMKVTLFDNNAIVKLGDGTKRHYKIYAELMDGVYYLLQREDKSDGNRRYYSYYLNNVFKLKEVKTKNRDESLTLNWLKFDYKGFDIFVTGSNGQKAHYKCQNKKGTAKQGNFLSGYTAKPTYTLLSQASIDNSSLQVMKCKPELNLLRPFLASIKSKRGKVVSLKSITMVMKG